ncbi:MAG: Gfo/Idh/MocA family protein, partial [Mangrovicoccus sp.]
TMAEAEFDQLIAKRDATGLLAAEAYMIVHHPQWQKAKSLLAEGAIGRLWRVDGAFSFNNRDMDNIRNKSESGGGLRDIGVYIFGSTRFVTGEEPSQLSADIRWENGVDVYAQINADFPSFKYSAFTSIRMHPRQEMVFHGEDGVITLRVPFNTTIFGEAQLELKRGTDLQVFRWPSTRQYELQVAAFNRSALDGGDYPCPLEFSRGTQRMIDMAFASAKKP